MNLKLKFVNSSTIGKNEIFWLPKLTCHYARVFSGDLKTCQFA